ncbi:MAG: O-antigen ligase family protein [Gemmatimonadaceae bacterium]
MPRKLGVGAAAIVASALVLTSSRTGLLGLVRGVVFFAAIARRLAPRQERNQALRAAALAVALIAAFGLHAEGYRYLRFIAGPLGPSAVSRIGQPTSEGIRLRNARSAASSIAERPLLGSGVMVGTDRAIGTRTFNTWLEVAVEAGLLGLAAFAFAILMTLRWASARAGPAVALASTAWLIHLVVNLNFTQTFPRLDYWLWFFLYARLARDS